MKSMLTLIGYLILLLPYCVEGQDPNGKKVDITY